MTALVRLVALAAVCACVCAQYSDEREARYIDAEPRPTSTPVPILKQINKHNEDGSYTYGFEAADGSFKIETKEANGEVKGKYGYRDDSGKIRVVEYGANKYGFQPAGEGITVAPPTLVDETTREEGLREERPSKSQGGRSQYRAPVQAQSLDYGYEERAPAPRPAPRPTPQQQYRPAPQQYQPAPQQYRSQQQSAPTPPKPAFFSGAAPAPIDQQTFFSPAQPQPRKQQSFKAPQQYQNSKPQLQYTQNFEPEQPAQRYNAAPVEPRYNSAPQQFSQPRNEQQFSLLDKLLKEYSLPAGGAAPLHDITFGSY